MHTTLVEYAYELVSLKVEHARQYLPVYQSSCRHCSASPLHRTVLHTYLLLLLFISPLSSAPGTRKRDNATMAKWFRSEEMEYISLIVNEDAAHDCLSDLGRIGVIQFTDVSCMR